MNNGIARPAHTTPEPLIGGGETKLKGPQVVLSELLFRRIYALVVLLCQ